MMLSDGLILSGYPGSRKFKRESILTSTYSEDHLRMALGIILNAGSKVNSTQLEFLKGALAQFQHNVTSDKSLVTAVEQILTTITNPNWVDREIMRQFFLDTAGFGSEMSLSSASLCIDRGIPSPQQLAAFIHVTADTEVLRWLGMNQVQFMLLKIALKPYLEQIELASSGDVVPRPLAEVWVDVGTPSAVDSVDPQESVDVDTDKNVSERCAAVEGAERGEGTEFSQSDVQEKTGNYDAEDAPHAVSPGTAIASSTHEWEGSSLSSYDQAPLSPPPPNCTLGPLSPACCEEGFLHTSASCDQSTGSWEHAGMCEGEGEGVEEVRSAESWSASAYSPVQSPISYIHCDEHDHMHDRDYESSIESSVGDAEDAARGEESSDDLSSGWYAGARWPCEEFEAASYTASSALLDTFACCCPDHIPDPCCKECVERCLLLTP